MNSYSHHIVISASESRMVMNEACFFGVRDLSCRGCLEGRLVMCRFGESHSSPCDLPAPLAGY